MSDLNGYDAAIILNRRVLSNLAISADLVYAPVITAAEQALEAAANVVPLLGTWLRLGLEDPVALAANLTMPLPRMLYATSNPSFPTVFAGNTDRERLLSRLQAYDSVASGPVSDILPPNVAGFDNPYPISLKRDLNSRFTFVRGNFFDLNRQPEVQVTSTGIRLTLRGSLFRGDLFSSYQATHNPTHTFVIALDYRVRFISNTAPSFGQATFVMTGVPPAGNPRLPAQGSVIFVKPLGNGRFALPDPSDPNKQANELTLAQPFRGQPGDLIFEPGNLTTPLYEVEPKSQSEPQLYVLRKIGSSQILAEGRFGRLALSFQGAGSLATTPVGGNAPISIAEGQVIGRSLSKINPTLAQQIVQAANLSGAAQRLQELDLAGPSGLDIPLLPRSLVIAANQEFDTNGAIKSDKVELTLTKDQYFPGGQSFGVSGMVNGPPPGTPFADFSAGSDLAMAVSERAMNIALKQVGKPVLTQVLTELQKQAKISTFDVTAFFEDGPALVALINVKGSKQLFIFDIGFEVVARVRLRLRPQPGIATRSVTAGGAEQVLPVDRFDCPIPLEYLQPSVPPIGTSPFWLGLAVEDGRVELADPNRNPLSFSTYWDPFDGIVPLGATPPLRVPPPVLPPVLLPAIPCTPGPDNPLYYGQASFPPHSSQNAGLKHQWDVAAAVPGKDDVKVAVNVDVLALILTIFVAGLIAAFAVLVPVVGLAAAPLLQFMVLNLTIALPFTNLILSEVATTIARQKIAERALPRLDLDLSTGVGVGLYLEDPAVRAPLLIQQNPSPDNPNSALIARYHAVANLPEAISAIPGPGRLGG
jgi:hypothetical protein